MQTLKANVLKNLIKQIEPYIVTQRLVIDEWKSHSGVHETAGNIVPDGAEPTVMHLGDRWNAGYDFTRFFEASVTVPAGMDGKKIYLRVDFGGEAIVRINGEIAGAVSSRENSGWVGRTDILFASPARGGEALNIQLESAVDCGGFCDRAIKGSKFMTYTMSTAELIAVDEACESYWFDITTAFDVYECTEDEYVKSRLYAAIDDSAHMLDFDFGQERFLCSVPSAAKKLWDMAGKIEYASPGRVIMAGHSHLDVAWLWTVKEITRKTARTFANNLALMDNYPDFRFTQSQAVLFDFVKKYYPELYERVKEKVKNGQWEIVGNAWVEADTNIASGESLIRQLLFGREFFLREFGVSSDTYWLPDCFGFTWALPQIIKRSGMKYFLTSKLQYNDMSEFPLSVFKWRSHSGDDVIAYMQKVHYQGDYDAAYIKNCRKSNRQNDITDVSFGMFGYGDGGGGCTYKMLEKGTRAAKLPGLPKSECGKVSDFFSAVEKDADRLPVWDGEMYYENHRGTFTSQAFVKKNNRRGEYLMRNAEILSVLAGGDYPSETLDEAWKLLLTNQFHDILPGTSIHEVFENCREEYKRMHALGNSVTDSAFKRLNAKINVSENSIAVWNLLPWSADGIVEVEIPCSASGVSDESGNLLPCRAREENGKNILAFRAENVRPMGYSVFTLTGTEKDFGCVTATKNLLENEYLRVELDGNALIDSVYDKKARRSILTGKGNLLTVSHDKPIHESAWNLELDYQKKMWQLESAESIEVVESSPLRGVVRVVRRFNESVITQDIILEAGKPTLDFETTVDWHEREKVLKAAFPVDIRSRSASCEIAHGSAEYPTHYNTRYDLAKFEFCAHKWADLSEGGYGASVLNDCKYGYDVHENVIRITLMRAPNCPDPVGDVGVSTFRYSFYPHSGNWRDAQTVKLGFCENVPLRAFFIEKNADGEDRGRSFITLSADNIAIDALMLARDGSGTIFRVYETETRHTEVTATIDLPFSGVVETNLMEVEERKIATDGRSFTFSVKPHEVKTFKLLP